MTHVDMENLDLESLAILQAQEKLKALEAFNALPAQNLSVEMASYHVSVAR